MTTLPTQNGGYDERQRALAVLDTEWPPADPKTLYDWGRTKLAGIGKETCLRAVLAAYQVHRRRCSETSYDETALRAAERWVIEPSEANRKNAGRVASVQTLEPSLARGIANIAGSQRRWPWAVGVGLTGNPHFLTTDQFQAICKAIESELRAWASGEHDPVADRHIRNARAKESGN